MLPTNTGSGSLLGRSANRAANPIPAKVYRARPTKAGLTTERPEVTLTATHNVGNSTTAPPSTMSKKVCGPRKKPANNANPRTSAAVDVTALKRCVRVVAKGAEAFNLAKVNPAPLSCGSEFRGKA